MELQGILVHIKDMQFNVFNVYIPPASANPRFVLDISRLLAVDEDSLILGNMNVHDAEWFFSISDSRGDSLAGQISNSKF
jgi:hypothetical protein